MFDKIIVLETGHRYTEVEIYSREYHDQGQPKVDVAKKSSRISLGVQQLIETRRFCKELLGAEHNDIKKRITNMYNLQAKGGKSIRPTNSSKKVVQAEQIQA